MQTGKLPKCDVVLHTKALNIMISHVNEMATIDLPPIIHSIIYLILETKSGCVNLLE